LNLNQNSLKILRENLDASAEKLFNEEQAYRIQKYLEDKANSLDNMVDFKENLTSKYTNCESDDLKVIEKKKNLDQPVVNIQSSRTVSSFWPSFLLLLSRGNKLLYRDHKYFLNRLFLDFMVYCLFALLFRQLGYDFQGIRNRQGA